MSFIQGPDTEISIHALREEGDGLMLLSKKSLLHFYPRPPRGGRRPAQKAADRPREISIHALREEGDRCARGMSIHLHDFYPRPPRGGRLTSAILIPILGEFLSTPSARRATEQADRYFSDFHISIHALREEGDRRVIGDVLLTERFLSTPSARRATKKKPLNQHFHTISIHALREEGDPLVPCLVAWPL